MSPQRIISTFGFALFAVILVTYEAPWPTFVILLLGYIAALLDYRKKPLPSWYTWKIKLGVLTAVWGGLLALHLYVGSAGWLFLMWVPFYVLHANQILKQRLSHTTTNN